MNRQLLFRLINHSFQEFLIERFTATITFIFGLLFFSLEIIAGFVFFEHTDTILGWSRQDYMLLVATASTISFLYQTIFVVSHENLSEAIIEGEMDYVLVRPVSSLLFYSLYRMDIPSALNLIVSIVAQVYILSMYTISIFNLALYIVAILLATYLLFLLNHFAVCVSFWVEKAGSIQGVPENLVEFASRPLVIYPNVIRFAFTWVVPILIGINLPILIVKGEKYLLYFVLLIVFNLLGAILARAIWKQGIKKYVSAN